MESHRVPDVGADSTRYLTMRDDESREAFILRLFDSFYERVFCFTRRSAPPDVAEDVTQDVFMRLLQHPRLDELSLSCSYLIKIAHNILRRRHTRWIKLQEILSQKVAEEPELRGRQDPPLRQPAPRGFTEALGTLKPEERDALDLIVCRGMSYEQAARSLDTSVTTINNHKYRGLQKLKNWRSQSA